MPEHEIRQFWCPDCKSQMQLIVDGKHHQCVDDDDYPTLYYFGHCVKCARPGVLSQEALGPNPSDWERPVQVFPTERTVTATLPPKVDQSFREARLCELAGAPLATAVMVRRTLEAIAREFDPEARTLFKGLHTMKDKGLISDELAQWGDALRFIGNIGAHPTDDVVTTQDAREALDFLVAIVETIYELRPKFQAMRARREKESVPPPEESPAEDSSKT